MNITSPIQRVILYFATGSAEALTVILILRWTTGMAGVSSLVPASIGLCLFGFLLRLHVSRQKAYTMYSAVFLLIVMLFFLTDDHVDATGHHTRLASDAAAATPTRVPRRVAYDAVRSTG